jgi:hypothetical protein
MLGNVENGLTWIFTIGLPMAVIGFACFLVYTGFLHICVGVRAYQRKDIDNQKAKLLINDALYLLGLAFIWIISIYVMFSIADQQDYSVYGWTWGFFVGALVFGIAGIIAKIVPWWIVGIIYLIIASYLFQ